MSSPLPNSEFQIRPRFQVVSSISVEQLKEIFKERLSAPEAICEGKVRHGYVSLYPRKEVHHYWSPHLSVIIEEEEGIEGTICRGVTGPSPPVWTMFVFVYAVLFLLIIISLVIGFANMQIDESHAILWAVPVLVLLFFSFYLTSFYGQKKGHHQMEEIYHFFEDCVGAKIEGH